MKKSNNVYDWLGNGFYFWENNLSRALIFAEEKREREPHKIKEPAATGAFIDLGYCFDLLDASCLFSLREYYSLLKNLYEQQGIPMPVNSPAGESFDLLLRKLDCSVIETAHAFKRKNNSPAYDSVRGVFWEGKELYPNAGFKEKNHIQICVRNPNCIKGFFLPRESDFHHPIP
jgi:hypothetical protein